jgi:hypothetical protein
MTGVTYDGVVEWMGSGTASEDQMKELRDALISVYPVEPETEPVEPDYWVIEGNDTAIQLGEKTIELIHRGPTQLKQIRLLKQWLTGHAKPALDMVFAESQQRELGNNTQATVNLLMELLDADALSELGCVVILEDKEFVEENFDIGWVFASAGIILKNQPALRRLTTGFFGRMG